MPAPVYVVAAGLTAAAATYAFVRFVYEPHIAPVLERLAEDFIERRRACRRERELQRQRERGGKYLTDPVQEIPLSARASSGDGGDDDDLSRRTGVKRKGTSESSSTEDGKNAGERSAPSLPAPGFPNLRSEVGASGVAIGLTPEEVNEWRNIVNKGTSVSLRQRKSTVISNKSGVDASWNVHSNVQGPSSADVAAQGRSHVLDEPNQPISQTPISPTSATASAPKSPFLSTPSVTILGSNTTDPPLRTERGQQRTPPAQVSPVVNQHRPHRLSDGLDSNRTSVSFADSAVSASSQSTLGLGLKPVFVVGEADDSVRGSAPSTTTQRTIELAEEGEARLTPATVQGLVLKLDMEDPSLRFLNPPKSTSSSPDRIAEHPHDIPNPNPTNPNPNSNHHPTLLSLSQSYPISLDYEQGIDLVSHPSESEPASSEYAFGSGFGTPSDRPGSPEPMDGATSPFVQLSPARLPLLTVPNAEFQPSSVPTIRQAMHEAERARSTSGSPRSTSSPTMFYSFTDDRQTAGQSVTQEQHTPDILSPMLSELEFSSDDGRTSSFASNDDFGSESSWTSAIV